MIALKQAITEVTTDLANLYADFDKLKADYVSGDRVSENGFYWELIPSTVVAGKKPSENPLYWEKVGVANKESLTDLRATTYSSKDDGFYIEFPIDYKYTYLAIGYYIATSLKIEAFDDLDNVIKTYYDETVSINQEVIDCYTYVYSPYTIEVDRVLYFKLFNVGKKLKITFANTGALSTARAGFVLCGDGVYLGKTKSDVNFGLNSYSIKKTDEFGVLEIEKRGVQDLLDFETTIMRNEFIQKRKIIKALYDEFCCFILDENQTTDNENIITLGVMERATQLYDEFDKSVIGFTVNEAI